MPSIKHSPRTAADDARHVSAGEVEIPQPAPDVVPLPTGPAHSPSPPEIAPAPPPEIIEPPGEAGERSPIVEPPITE